MTTEHRCTCRDVDRLLERVTELEETVKQLKAAVHASPRVRNVVSGDVGSVLQAGDITNLTIQ